jgi:hypothetical protein
MLVLLGPGYEGRDDEVNALIQETGLTSYDLRARLCPGTWGVIKAFADGTQASRLTHRLLRFGLPVCEVSSNVSQDVNRPIVYLREVRFESESVILRLSEREMAVPYGALLVVIRGDVHLGRVSQNTSNYSTSNSIRPSSTALSTMSLNTNIGELGRETRGTIGQDVFCAADLHFVTVPWIGRIDAREFIFPTEFCNESGAAERLDRFVDDMATRAGIRVDRAFKTSSLTAHAIGPLRASTPSSNGPISVRRGPGQCDELFDGYSRLVAEAERQVLSRTLGIQRILG